MCSLRDAVAVELHDDAEGESHRPAGGGDPGEESVHCDVVRERDHELVHDLVLSDRP